MNEEKSQRPNEHQSLGSTLKCSLSVAFEHQLVVTDLWRCTCLLRSRHTGDSVVCAESLQSCPTLCDPMDCSPSGPSVHGAPGKNTRVRGCFLLQGIFPTQGLNLGLLHLPALAGGLFTTSATWEAIFCRASMK